MSTNPIDNDKLGSATLFGTAILSNLRFDSDNPRFHKQIIFDSQFVMKNGEDMVSALRYWNNNDHNFAEKEDGSLGRYIVLATVTAIDSTANIRVNEDEMEYYHLVGDILWMQELPSAPNYDDVFDPPFVLASGRVLSIDNNSSSFDLESYPWVGIYRAPHKICTRARFDTSLHKFKNRLPMPNVGRIVSVCGPLGTLHEIPSETTSGTTANAAYMIGVEIHDIGFLSPLQMPVLASSPAPPSTPSRRGRRFPMRARGTPVSSGRLEEESPSPAPFTYTPPPSHGTTIPTLDNESTEITPTPAPALPTTVAISPAPATISDTAVRRNLRKRRRDNDQESSGGNDDSGSLSNESTLTQSTS